MEAIAYGKTCLREANEVFHFLARLKNEMAVAGGVDISVLRHRKTERQPVKNERVNEVNL